MADLKELEHRLKEIGCNFRFWGRSELRELANILLPNETVYHCVNGTYQGGFAMLVATDQRVLLIDKKPMYLSLEDIRYDMISEVDFNHRAMDANIHVITPNRSLRFVAYNQGRLRKMFHYVQTRVMEIRQHYHQAAQNMQTQQYIQYAQQIATLPQQVPSPLPAQAPQPGQPDQLFEAIVVPQSLPQQQQAQQLLPPMPMYTPLVAPIISAYTRLPMLSRQRRFLGSRALGSPMSSIYNSPQP